MTSGPAVGVEGVIGPLVGILRPLRVPDLDGQRPGRVIVDEIDLVLPLAPCDPDILRHAKEVVNLPRRQKRLLAPFRIRPQISQRLRF